MQAAAAVKMDASALNSDIHATAAYRANLISVLTQRGVTQAPDQAPVGLSKI